MRYCVVEADFIGKGEALFQLSDGSFAHVKGRAEDAREGDHFCLCGSGDAGRPWGLAAFAIDGDGIVRGQDTENRSFAIRPPENCHILESFADARAELMRQTQIACAAVSLEQLVAQATGETEIPPHKLPELLEIARESSFEDSLQQGALDDIPSDLEAELNEALAGLFPR